MFNHQLFRQTIQLLILLELLSLAAWFFPVVNAVCFFVILAIVFALSLMNLKYGLTAVLAELVIGSYGYLFSFNYGVTWLSLRFGLFVVILLAWLIYLMRNRGVANFWLSLKNFIFFKYYLALAIVLIWGFIWGIIRGHDFGFVFLDFNNWLFLLYLLPLITVINYKQNFGLSVARAGILSPVNRNDQSADNLWRDFAAVFLGSLIILIFNTFLFLYVFSHNFSFAWPELYTWIRDVRLGEITRAPGGLYRIFLQSQIYALLGFFVFLPLLMSARSISKLKYPLLNCYIVILPSCLATVIISFSRSFWMGFIAGIVTYYFLQIIVNYLAIKNVNKQNNPITNYQLRITNYRQHLKNFFRLTSKLLIICLLSLALVFTLVYAPPGLGRANLLSSISERGTIMEAAGSSRLNMLKPLWQGIIKHPVVGSGFGATITYQSLDPRVTAATAGRSGEYTTYAFEWGYLDLLLKIGAFGLFIYLLLIFKLLQKLWAQIKFQILNFKFQMKSKIQISNLQQTDLTFTSHNGQYPISNIQYPLGLFLALVSLLVVNIFTPYLNHPLGLSFIMLMSIYIDSNYNLAAPKDTKVSAPSAKAE